MKTQILPNWCKKLGLALLIIFSVLASRDKFMQGWNSIDCADINCIDNKTVESNIDNNNINFYFGEKTSSYFDALSFLGILIYLLSKEKIEDDYVSQLRLESFQLTAIIIIIISIFLYAFTQENLLNMYSFAYLYLIIHFFKKLIYV